MLPASGCAAAAEINFTIHEQTPAALVLHRIYQKRALSRRWQECGIPLLVDMNIPAKWFGLNLLGVPHGWRAYINRAYSSDIKHLLDAHEAASERANGPIFYVVYGGGAKVRELCLKRGWFWIQDDNDRARGRSGETAAAS